MLLYSIHLELSISVGGMTGAVITAPLDVVKVSSTLAHSSSILRPTFWPLLFPTPSSGLISSFLKNLLTIVLSLLSQTRLQSSLFRTAVAASSSLKSVPYSSYVDAAASSSTLPSKSSRATPGTLPEAVAAAAKKGVLPPTAAGVATKVKPTSLLWNFVETGQILK